MQVTVSERPESSIEVEGSSIGSVVNLEKLTPKLAARWQVGG